MGGDPRGEGLSKLEVTERIELLVRDRDPKADEGSIARQKSATREKAARDPSFAACPKEVSAHAFDCAMAAPNADELEKCLE